MARAQNAQQGQRGPSGGPEDMPPPFLLLSQLLNPANARSGDAVWSQEAFDRVMSQLMEQNQGSAAPGPASEQAIAALPTRKIDVEDLGTDGKAECSICMDNVEVGEEVTSLPCTHWFHKPCVTAWLKEHDTCPQCRAGITKMPENGEQDAGSSGSSHRRHSRRSSSVSSPRSPNLATRMSGTGREMPRPSRQSSRREGANTEADEQGGGVSGWIRSHNPFG